MQRRLTNNRLLFDNFVSWPHFFGVKLQVPFYVFGTGRRSRGCRAGSVQVAAAHDGRHPQRGDHGGEGDRRDPSQGDEEGRFDIDPGEPLRGLTTAMGGTPGSAWVPSVDSSWWLSCGSPVAATIGCSVPDSMSCSSNTPRISSAVAATSGTATIAATQRRRAPTVAGVEITVLVGTRSAAASPALPRVRMRSQRPPGLPVKH